MFKAVLTGGPSAGKTTIANSLLKDFYNEIAIVPEAAGILYRGGFPRVHKPELKLCQQRAIYKVQVEMEELVHLANPTKGVICDRGTLDGVAYWPPASSDFYVNNHTSLGAELNRYDLVIHLSVAKREDYNSDHSDIRIENFEQALAIDKKILEVWSTHPRRIVISNNCSFSEKIHKVHQLIQEELQKFVSKGS